MRRVASFWLTVVIALTLIPRLVQGDELLDRVEKLAKEVAPAVIECRRDVHAHPELANREERTARVVAERLKAIGLDEIKTGVAHHGVVALIRGSKPGPCVALRADMDALPIQERTGLPFASQNEGVMHACGHDAHTAMLLGAAQVLTQMRDVMPGTVKLIFQPAEEGTPPGEQGGAKLMIAEGALEKPHVSAIFGMHVNPELPTGKLGYRCGALLAAVDRFKVTVHGKQSHAAMPWLGVDPIVASAQIVTAIQTIASRNIDARQPVVVSVGVFRAGQAWNIIPEEVVLEGTIRSHAASAFGTSAEIEFDDYGPVVWNDPKLGPEVKKSLARAVGEGNVVEVQPVMGGEDFAHYAQAVPGFYIFLGVQNANVGAVHPPHTPEFTVDEAALVIGVRTHCLMALDYLRSQ
jgi:metal-dependent amidase/aminoacylase/carboxypeptidase family protein